MARTGRLLALFVALALLIGLGGSFARVSPTAAAGPEIDPQLARQLGAVAPDATLQAILTYDHQPTDADVAAARATGVLVHRFSQLPMLGAQGTPAQLRATFGRAGLLSAYHNQPLQYFLHESVPLIGADRVWSDLGYTGKGVGVAVLDSGVDATHRDLTFGPVTTQNVKILAPGFFGGGAVIAENLPNSDTSSGHGTHVAGTVAGRGTASNGYYRGVAPGANLIGIGAGDGISILFALQGFDWMLANQAKYNIRVMSNSWGTTGEFAAGNPINVASKQAHDRGITVVFASGNEGPGEDTLNPYSVAPWVIGVAAGAKDGKTLADFSSRGRPGDALYHPTITAPGVNIVAARAPNTVVPGTGAPKDASINPAYLPYYTTLSGTSMATPHVSGVLALMLEANPALGPDILKDLLIRTATPMAGYQEFEVGAGYIDAYAATGEAKITSPTYGSGTGQDGKPRRTIVQTGTWSGTVGASAADVSYSSDFKELAIGANALSLTVEVAWTNPVTDIDLYVYDPAGATEGNSGQAATTSEKTVITTIDGSPLPAGAHKVETRGYVAVAEPYQGKYSIEYIAGKRRR